MRFKNVVFDFGQVMVRFDPAYMVGQYVTDPRDAKQLEEVLFDRLYWDALDKGTISDEAVLLACRDRLPERLWEVAEKIYYNWIYHLPEIPGMHALSRRLKEEYGVKLLLLSNISEYFAAHSHEIPCLRHFDGLVLTGPLGIVKPHPEIFDYLCRTYGIFPEETVFIDDNPANIAGAKAFGLHAYLFDGDAEKLAAWLEAQPAPAQEEVP